MAMFHIAQATNPREYKTEVCNFWKEYLPDTPVDRFEWIMNNPEGPAIWYLAVHEKTGKVAGTLSIMPRRIKVNGHKVVAGIVGDFMVERQFQVFGPALQLMKKAINSYQDLGFSFLYTYPNRTSEKVVLRAGFQRIGTINRLVRPLQMKYQLMKYFRPALASLISPFLDQGLKLISREPFIEGKGTFIDLKEPGSDYYTFWREIENEWSTLGERTPEYLKWKYLQNPLYRFHIFTYKEPLNNSILGYIIFTALHNSAHIFDIITQKEGIFKKMLIAFFKTAKKSGYHSVSLITLHNNPLLPYIRSCGFFKRDEHNPLLFAGNSALIPREWIFFDGDRNL